MKAIFKTKQGVLEGEINTLEIKFATITSAAEVKFDGDTETIPINRHYKNALYIPTIGDRVYFLCQGNVKILEGKVVK